MAGGRPTTYCTELATELCRRLAAGPALAVICRADDMPAQRTVYEWRDAHQEFSQQLARAREIQTDTLGDGLLQIHEDKHLDRHQQRLKAENTKFYIRQMNPNTWGDGRQVAAVQSGADAIAALLAKAVGDAGQVGPSGENDG